MLATTSRSFCRVNNVVSKVAVQTPRYSTTTDYSKIAEANALATEKAQQPIREYLDSDKPLLTPQPAEFYDLPQATQDGLTKVNQIRSAAEIAALDKYGVDLHPAFHRYNALKEVSDSENCQSKTPIRIAVTGASGQLGYALLFRIASGGIFGLHTQPIELQLLELEHALPALEGVAMELRDCYFPSVVKITCTSNPEKAFEGADYAFLVGSKPRGPGMERGDLLKANGEIFTTQGKALNKTSKKENTRVIVVGNPANTNALICSANAKDIPAENFQALTRLDHNRGLAQLAEKAKCGLDQIERFAIWGNHSATQFPDISHAKIGGKWATDVITDQKWLTDSFYPDVQKRGAAIIKARGLSSAASAASSVIDACHDWHWGTNGNWVSSAVPSTGEYGVTPGLFYSYPVVYANKQYDIVRDLPITEAAAVLMEATHQELLSERDAVASLLPHD